MNGDVITRANIGEMLDAHLASDAMITVGATTYIHKVPFGCLECDDASNVTGLLEKPMLTRLINTGIYVINPEALEWIPYNESYPITNLLTEALNQNKCVQSYMITDWLDIGQLNQLNKANGIE